MVNIGKLTNFGPIIPIITYFTVRVSCCMDIGRPEKTWKSSFLNDTAKDSLRGCSIWYFGVSMFSTMIVSIEIYKLVGIYTVGVESNVWRFERRLFLSETVSLRDCFSCRVSLRESFFRRVFLSESVSLGECFSRRVLRACARNVGISLNAIVCFEFGGFRWLSRLSNGPSTTEF